MTKIERPPTQRLQPFHAQLHDQEELYREAFVPSHPPLTMRRIAEGILVTRPDQYPYAYHELITLQTQLRKLLSPPSAQEISDVSFEDQVAEVIRKDADHDNGRQVMLESLLASIVGIPPNPVLPKTITPEMLAYYLALRQRKLQGIKRTDNNIPYKAESVIQVNAMEDALLTLPQKSFLSRFEYLRQAVESIGSIFLGSNKPQLQQELYGILKGAVSAAAIRIVLEKHLPPHTELHAPLIEFDMMHAIDGIGILLPEDCIAFTGQYKSSSLQIPPETPLHVRSPGTTSTIDLSPIVRRLNYHDLHKMPVIFIPTLVALPTPSGPIVQLNGITPYNAQFDANGKWINPFHLSWDKFRPLSSHRFVESSYKVWQHLSTVFPTYPHGITAIFGLVNYHDLEEWHRKNEHTLPDQEKHVIDAFYAFRKEVTGK